MFVAEHRDGSRTGSVFLLVLALACPVVLGLLWLFRPDHLRAPTPRGMVLRTEAREVVSPMDRIEVRRAFREEPAIAVFAPGTRTTHFGPEPCTTDTPDSLVILRYPEGSLIERWVGREAMEEWSELLAHENEAAEFDFDGDGRTDEVLTGPSFDPFGNPEATKNWSLGRGAVEVRSGSDGRVLFADLDPLEYETFDRAFPLGDLDGDGFAELALVHPRMDRSGYDFELCDRIFGAKSWICVVSGKLATR